MELDVHCGISRTVGRADVSPMNPQISRRNRALKLAYADSLDQAAKIFDTVLAHLFYASFAFAVSIGHSCDWNTNLSCQV